MANGKTLGPELPSDRTFGGTANIPEGFIGPVKTLNGGSPADKINGFRENVLSVSKDDIQKAVDKAEAAKNYSGSQLDAYNASVSDKMADIHQQLSILDNTKDIPTGVGTARSMAVRSLKMDLVTAYADMGMSADDIDAKISGFKTTDDVIKEATDVSSTYDANHIDGLQLKDPVPEEKEPEIIPVAQEAVNYYTMAKNQSINATEYFNALDNTLYEMGSGMSKLNNLRDAGYPSGTDGEYNEAITDVQTGLAVMYAKEGMSAQEVSDKLSTLKTADDYLEAAFAYNDNVLNAKERIDEANREPEEREWTFDGEMYTFPDGRQLSRDNYVLLCNAVGHEAGANWIGTQEKARCVEAIMRRCGGDTNNLPAVLGDPTQFAGNSAYVGRTDFTSNVSPMVEDAVMNYFCFPEQYDPHCDYFWYGDGVKNYFTRLYSEHQAVGSAVQRGDYFTASLIEYESENIQRTANREASIGAERAEALDFVDYSDPGNEVSDDMEF